MTVTELNERAQKKASLIVQARALSDLALSEKRDLTDSEKRQYSTMLAEVQKLKGGTDRDVQLGAEEAELSKPRPTVVGGRDQVGDGPSVELNAKQFSKEQRVSGTAGFRGGSHELDWAKQIRGYATGRLDDFSPEEKRVLQEGVGGAGGFTLSEQQSGLVIDMSRDSSVCIQAGTQTVLLDQAEAQIAVVLSDPISQFIPEGGEIISSDINFGAIHVKAEILACMCRCSIQLLQDSAGIDAIIRNGLTKSIGLALDSAILQGSGVGGFPLGIFNTLGISTISCGVNGSIPTSYDYFLDAIAAVEANNGVAGQVVMNSRTKATLAKLKESTTLSPLRPPDDYTKLGQFITNAIPSNLTWGTAHTASMAIVGDFRDSLIALAPTANGSRQIRIDLSTTGTGFSSLNVDIRAFLRVDTVVTKANHFARICGILA